LPRPELPFRLETGDRYAVTAALKCFGQVKTGGSNPQQCQNIRAGLHAGELGEMLDELKRAFSLDSCHESNSRDADARPRSR